jgi:trimeric autotransporter adhesin
VITTVAGGGAQLSDNVPATSARLNYPSGISVDSAGNLYIAETPPTNDLRARTNTDPGDYRIRKISNGVITTVAGADASTGFDVLPPEGIVAVDSKGDLYFAGEIPQARALPKYQIRKLSNGSVATVAGGGDYFCDDCPATSSQLNRPAGVAVDSAGNLYIADAGGNRIRKVSNGVITTVAGNGDDVFIGENGPATGAQLRQPAGVAVDSQGNIYITEPGNVDAPGRVRKVSNGIITTVADSGERPYSGRPPVSRVENGFAIAVGMQDTWFSPVRIAVDSAGSLYVAERPVSVRIGVTDVIKLSEGAITLVAADEQHAPPGAGVLYAADVAVDSAGAVYIADSPANRIRKVSGGVITTVAGDGTPGFSGDNGPATRAQLNRPMGVAVDPAGNLYIADLGNNRVRKVANGVITTVAGNGIQGFSGDGGPATSAQLSPHSIAVDRAGNLYIVSGDYPNHRIRKVSGGVITTIAANGAERFTPSGIAVDAAGKVYFADSGYGRIRLLTPSSAPCSSSVSPTDSQAAGGRGTLTFSIKTSASCPWAVQSLPEWITYSGNAVGAGSATVTLALAPNSSTAPRSAIVSIAGMSVYVTQRPGP